MCLFSLERPSAFFSYVLTFDLSWSVVAGLPAVGTTEKSHLLPPSIVRTQAIISGPKNFPISFIIGLHNNVSRFQAVLEVKVQCEFLKFCSGSASP